MRSPFSDFSDVEVFNTPLQETEANDVESPLLDPTALSHETVLMRENSPDDHELFDAYITGQTSAKIGDITFAVADNTVEYGDDYREPLFSGNPLLVIAPTLRTKLISKNFQAGEFAQAQSGKYKFNFARIDPALVDNLQRLRSFIGKSIEVVDGYYSPKYFKSVLGEKDIIKLSLNPHIFGKAVKVNIPTFKGMIKQIAIASFVACDKDVAVGIGTSTMTLAVKQPVLKNIDDPVYDSRVQSYIDDEKLKVSTINFCVDVKRILQLHLSVYDLPMRKAVSALAAGILQLVYRVNVLSPEQLDWKTPLRTVISLMHMVSTTKDPNVILYCLAYSHFGNLFRVFSKDKTGTTTAQRIFDNLKYHTDRDVHGSFIYAQRENKAAFIDYCMKRILVGIKLDGTVIRLVSGDFFDWKNNPHDKTFMETISAIINDEYAKNRYGQSPAPQQTPEGGTLRKPVITPPNPDKPLNDFTGRYWSPAPAGDKDFHGRYFLVNQAGKYVAGKYGVVYRGPIKSLKNSIYEFYGVIDDKGNAICTVYPQQTLILKRSGGETRAYLLDNTTDTVKLSLPLMITSGKPIFSKLILNSLINKFERNEDLMLILAWVRPPAAMLKEHLQWFGAKDKDVKTAISNYNKEDETQPSVKRLKLGRYVSDLDSAISRYGKLPPMFSPFVVYYTRQVYSVSPHWTPRNDRETRSTSDWIKKMLEDYRDLALPSELSRHKDIYDYFGISMERPKVEYQYKITIKVNAIGIGPFSRSSGTILVENKTDYAKYPNQEKWSSNKLGITIWSATLSLNPLKFAPKISFGEDFEGTVKTPIFYSASDFSGADVQITEGKLFEVPIPLGSSSDLKGSTKLSKAAYIILVKGQGKALLEFNVQQDFFERPDTLELEPDIKGEKESTYEKIAKMLPSLTMYTGSIDEKKTSADIQSIPLPDEFSSLYHIQDRRYFKHDSAELSAQAIEAIGRLCAEELIAFSDPESQVEIYGHTDASGKPAYNLDLSKTRALNTWQAINDRLGTKLKAKLKKLEGLGETVANVKHGQQNEKNPWLRTVVVIINGRAVLSLNAL